MITFAHRAGSVDPVVRATGAVQLGFDMFFERKARITDGGPQVKRGKDKDGNLKYTVNAYILNPWVAFGLDILRPILVLAAGIGGVYVAAIQPDEFDWWVYPIIVLTPVVFYWPIRKILYSQFENRLIITIRKDTLTIQYLFSHYALERNMELKWVAGRHPWSNVNPSRRAREH